MHRHHVAEGRNPHARPPPKGRAGDGIDLHAPRPEYREGSTLGKGRNHWFRAEVLQQYRLSFRHGTKGKIIVHAWANDESSKGACGRTDDAYEVFQNMLASGRAPDGWNDLVAELRRNVQRLKDAVEDGS